MIRTFLVLGGILRLGLIAFSEYSDKYTEVKYTDIDYLVYTDASFYVSQGQSPYERHTYRYTPLLAYLLIPNLYLSCWGKIIFAMGDLACAWLVYLILKDQTKSPEIWMSLILFNPLIFNVSTRGSSDSLCTLLILATLLFLKQKRIGLAGICYGLAVHFRIYPIVYALSLYLSIDKEKYKFFTWNRVIFTLISGGLFLLLIGFFYLIYGFEFLYETYLYHFIRKDNRHNFSLYFYLLYLTYNSTATLWGLLSFIPQWGLIIYTSFRLASKDLWKTLLVQTFIFVVFNKVCTAQYFIWYFGLLPLVLPFTNISKLQGLFIIALWLITEPHWLYWGYQLEFLGRAVFLQLWFASILFFLANIYATFMILVN